MKLFQFNFFKLNIVRFMHTERNLKQLQKKSSASTIPLLAVASETLFFICFILYIILIYIIWGSSSTKYTPREYLIINRIFLLSIFSICLDFYAFFSFFFPSFSNSMETNAAWSFFLYVVAASYINLLYIRRLKKAIHFPQNVL